MYLFYPQLQFEAYELISLPYISSYHRDCHHKGTAKTIDHNLGVFIINPVKTKLCLSDLKTQHVPRSKHSLPRL
jgi:hypothetical protein